jgi:hypothetical protein
LIASSLSHSTNWSIHILKTENERDLSCPNLPPEVKHLSKMVKEAEG